MSEKSLEERVAALEERNRRQEEAMARSLEKYILGLRRKLGLVASKRESSPGGGFHELVKHLARPIERE